jgi:mono/diheme cytochrome c family protein
MSDQHRSLTIFAGLAVLLVIFLLPFLPGTSKPRPNGEYLVESVAICFECHSERDFSKPGWPIPPGRKGSGRILRGEGTADPIVAPNISPDKETGIGAWTDEEIKRAIIGGISRHGRQLHPEMPYHYFNLLSAPELKAMVMYLRSMPPVKNALPKMPNYVAGPNSPRVPMDSIQLTAPSDAIKRGQYLVRLAGCETCHTPRNVEGFIKGMEFAGGSVFRHRNEEADAASNLTPDPTGIGSYNEQQFIQIIRTGHSGGRAINSAMPWHFYRNMTDSDLKAIFAYLKALPPISHKIDNTQPPSSCPKCGNPHGLGNQN